MDHTILQLIPYPNEVIRKSGWCRRSDRLQIQEGEVLGNPEGYCLDIREDGIRLAGAPAGIFYGKQTLCQLKDQFGGELPCMEIMDAPHFSYRGFMLDSSRHFLPKEDIKRLLDAAALLKLNKLHWHLVDDQGWRIEIRKYPKLTGIGARRGKADFARLPEPEETHDFFTQDDIREIVAYAADRFIDIVPELEIPGHESALLAAYPEYSCEGTDPGELQVQITGGIFREILCAGNEKTAFLLRDILDEYMELFPYSYLHLGGDEAVKAHWRSCPRCQAKIKELGLSDENALQQWLVRSMADYLEERGRHAVVWNDVLRGEKLSSKMAVQMWLGDKDLIEEFTSRGGRIIQSATDFCYLDYPYSTIDVKKIIAFDPVPDYLKDREEQVWGIECPLWAERVTDLKRAAFQLFPRLPAMAEKAWMNVPSDAGGMKNPEDMQNGEKKKQGTAGEAVANPCEDSCRTDRDYEDFCRRYGNLRQELEKMGLEGAPEKYWNMTPEDAARDQKELEDLLDTPFLQKFREEEEALLASEREVYGRF